MSIREVKESPKVQGPDERLKYVFDFSAWGVSTPTDPVVEILTARDLTNTSATNLSGAATVAGSQVTTPLVVSLTAGQSYVLTVKITSGDEVREAFVRIQVDPY